MPYRQQISLCSRLAPDEVKQRLARLVEPPNGIHVTSSARRDYPFAGSIRGNHFSISKMSSWGRRTSTLSVDGEIYASADGSRIDVIFSPSGIDMILGFLLIGAFVFISGMFIYLTITGEVAPSCGLFPIGVLLFALFIARSLGAASPDEATTKALFMEAFEAVQAEPLTPNVPNE